MARRRPTRAYLNLNRSQRRLARILHEEAKRSGATPREEKAAYLTARVEANFGNPVGGHGTSSGWRQEINSYGSVKRRRNVRGAAGRFYREARGLRGRKLSSGALAQAVQRSARPERYRQHSREGQDLLSYFRGGGGGRDGGPTARASGGGSVTVPGAKATTPVEPGGTGLVELLREIQGPPQPTPSAPLQAPAFSASARVPLPAAYQPVQSSGGPGPPQSALAEQLAAISQLRGPEPSPVQEPDTTVSIPGSKGARAPKGSKSISRRGQVNLRPGADRAGVRTNRKVLRFAEKVAGIYGKPLTVGTGTNHSRMTASGNVSDHWDGNAVDIPAAGRQLYLLGYAALRAAGIPRSRARSMAKRGGIFNVRGVQIIVRTDDHWDHLHIGRP